MKKGNSIYQFLQRCMDTLKKEEAFAELKVASADQLMYVKEDLILPHHSTFFDFIVTKARGQCNNAGVVLSCVMPVALDYWDDVLQVKVDRCSTLMFIMTSG